MRLGNRAVYKGFDLKFYSLIFLGYFLTTLGCEPQPQNSIPISIENHQEGAPVKMGVPFPEGELQSPDNILLQNESGEEIPVQVTEVTTWEPLDQSLKWVWLFFFADEYENYTVHYGEDINPKIEYEHKVSVTNNQRVNGEVTVDTGTLRFQIEKGGAGFFDSVQLNSTDDDFLPRDTIATGIEGRGTFLDMMNEAGVDTSNAIIEQTFVERGTGPLHAIVRVEGFYEYESDELPDSPFTTRIHAYAGKSFVRILHTLTYTGTPDQSAEREGEHAAIATQAEHILSEDELENDTGFTEPGDMISAVGLQMNLKLEDHRTLDAGYYDSKWWQQEAEPQTYSAELSAQEKWSVLQTGPDVTGIPPVEMSSADERIDGFRALIESGSESLQTERAEGWSTVTDGERGVSIGMVNMLEEYPNEIRIGGDNDKMGAFFWSDKTDPMSFQRASTEPDGGMVGNFATGLTKTSEVVFYFHEEEEYDQSVVDYFLDPIAAHADPKWYSDSEVFGKMYPETDNHGDFQRSLNYKFDWFLFNQRWEPWYGEFYYGDGKTNYYDGDWMMWGMNEPSQDYMWWMQYIRTGNPQYLRAARAKSRFSMDIGNIHWPADPEYRGDTNVALDWWENEEVDQATPYLGMGRRHASQPWISQLSAHVWTQGWIASYYLDGYHRGLDVARKTADYYTRRIFGEHGLTGRRLYLSLWNLIEVWDATKDPAYLEELNDRFERMIQKQQKQGGGVLIDRYGYSQAYVSQGLSRYYQSFGDERAKRSLIQHARHIRDFPPMDHQMESYLATIHSLLMGYEYTGNREFYITAWDRAQFLRTGQMEKPINEDITQAELAEKLESVSSLPYYPEGEEHAFFGSRPIWSITNGLRVFGWTHAFNVPYLLYYLEHEGPPTD